MTLSALREEVCINLSAYITLFLKNTGQSQCYPFFFFLLLSLEENIRSTVIISLFLIL